MDVDDDVILKMVDSRVSQEGEGANNGDTSVANLEKVDLVIWRDEDDRLQLSEQLKRRMSIWEKKGMNISILITLP